MEDAVHHTKIDWFLENWAILAHDPTKMGFWDDTFLLKGTHESGRCFVGNATRITGIDLNDESIEIPEEYDEDGYLIEPTEVLGDRRVIQTAPITKIYRNKRLEIVISTAASVPYVLGSACPYYVSQCEQKHRLPFEEILNRAVSSSSGGHHFQLH